MSGFRESVASDNRTVFLNVQEFGEKRIVIYNGVTYDGPEHEGIPVVIRGLKEQGNR